MNRDCKSKRALEELRLFLVVLATAVMLGGCVAEAADEEEEAVAQTGTADTFVPKVPKDPGGSSGKGSGSGLNVTAAPTGGTVDPGGASEDPDPNPWKPASH